MIATRSNRTMQRPTLPRLLWAIAPAAACLLASAPASSSDSCKLFLHSNQQTPLFTAWLQPPHGPGIANEWGNNSSRFSGDDMKYYQPAYWWQSSSATIEARDTDVYLYLFTGEHFDGSVAGLWCPKGKTCPFDLEPQINDKVRSFICQADYPRTTEQEWEVVEIPMVRLFEPIAEKILESIPQNKNLSAELEQLQITWTNLHATCEHALDLLEANETVVQGERLFSNLCGPAWPLSYKAKYVDLLRVSVQLEVTGCERIIWWFCRTKDMYIDMWVRPVLSDVDGFFRFTTHPAPPWHGGWFTVYVPGERARDAFTRGGTSLMSRLYDGGGDDLGDLLTQAVWNRIEQECAPDYWPGCYSWVVYKKSRLQLGYSRLAVSRSPLAHRIRLHERVLVALVPPTDPSRVGRPGHPLQPKQVARTFTSP